PFAELALALGRAQRRPPADDARPLLVPVMRMVGPLFLAGRPLVHAAADQLGADPRADPAVLEDVVLVLGLQVPLVAVQVVDPQRRGPTGIELGEGGGEGGDRGAAGEPRATGGAPVAAARPGGSGS